jgi:hypothetical protein
MSLLAEELVEEWLNQEGFFTIRGLRTGHDEIDLLGIKYLPNSKPEAWHVEVSVSMRPAGYIAKLTKEIARHLNKARGSAAKRTPEQMEESIRDWVYGKFKSKNKVKARDELFPGLRWKYFFIHGKIKHQEELPFIEKEGVELLPIKHIIENPSKRCGGDLTELINYLTAPTRQKM